MSLLDGGQTKDLPTMSWSSVVDDESVGTEPAPPTVVEQTAAGTAAPGGVTFEIPGIDAGPAPAPPAGDAPAATAAPAAPADQQGPPPADPVGGGGLGAISFSIPDLESMVAPPADPPAPPTAPIAAEPATGMAPAAPATASAEPLSADAPVAPMFSVPDPGGSAAGVAPAPAAEPQPPSPASEPEPGIDVVVPPPPPSPVDPLVATPAGAQPVDHAAASATSVAASPAPVAPPAPPLDEAPPQASPPSPPVDQTPPRAVPPAPAVDQTPPRAEPPPPAVDQTPPRAVPPAPAVDQTPHHAAAPAPAVHAAPPIVPSQQAAVPVQQHVMPGALPGAPQQQLKGQRKSSGNLLAVVLTLLVIGALVVAAVVYGRPYLFPDEWDEAARPYAESVENVRGAQFVEPVTITPEAPALYETRRSLQLVGDWEAELPVWRSLGLANGRVDGSTVDQLLDGLAPVLYSESDGQIYHDGSLVGPTLDAHLTRAMSAAAIDQDFGWSTSQSTRLLDDAALVEAHVIQQSTFIQEASDFPAPIVDGDPAPLFFLPPVLGYELVAPSMYVELLPAFDLETVSANPLEDIGIAGPGPLPTEAPVLANAAVLAGGELVIEQPVAMDTSFWFLVVAAYLEAPQAYAASNAIVENSLAVVDRAGQTCTVATFSGGDAAQAEMLRGSLEAWSITAPAEFGATVSVLPDGTIQFSSCDPGVDFENGSRLGAAHELIGYRMGEIATAVSLDGAPAGEVAAALAAYEVSGLGDGLAALPLNTTPVNAAAAARAAVGAPALGAPELGAPALVPEPTGG